MRLSKRLSATLVAEGFDDWLTGRSTVEERSIVQSLRRRGRNAGSVQRWQWFALPGRRCAVRLCAPFAGFLKHDAMLAGRAFRSTGGPLLRAPAAAPA